MRDEIFFCSQGSSVAGPQMEGGRNTSWWMVDIGPDHQVRFIGLCMVSLFVHNGRSEER